MSITNTSHIVDNNKLKSNNNYDNELSINCSIPNDWSKVQLKNIGNTFTGISGKNKDDFGFGKPYIPYLNIFNNAIIKDDHFDYVNIKDNETQEKVKYGDIFFTTSSETPEEVGMCSVYLGNSQELYLNSFCFGFRLTNDIDFSPIYLAELFRSNVGRKTIFKLAQGATRYNLSKTSLLKENIFVPPFKQQQKIAAILSTWDEAIFILKQTSETLRDRNKGLAQQLLTGKKKLKGFNDIWLTKRIKDFSLEISSKNKEDEDLIVLSCTKHRGLIPSLEYFGRKIYSDNLKTYKIVEKNVFAYATNHIEEGSIGYQSKYEKALISPMYTVFKTEENINDEFLFRVLKSNTYIQEYQKRMEGSIDRRGGLRWQEFSKIKVSVPSYEEQTAIALTLETADQQLKSYQNKLEALQLQKKGLMQQLLTGKIRVNVK
jgi:type I restriction enzyme S subunit